ncbi:sensor histidine kinase [gamma proteobacterium HTCC5015]|nr:sensor histidine kinase [gamma proteobacterium HTCC5015]
MRSLFWKIFSSVWLANIIIMVGTTHTILVLAQRDAREEQIIAEARQLTEQILQENINNKQRWTFNPKRPESPSLLPLTTGLGAMPSLHFDKHLQIRTESGELVFGPSGDLREESAKSIAFTFTAKGGDLYQVVTIPPEEPMFILEDLTKRMQSISMLVIFFVSGIVSLMLTVIITRPVKRLSRHTRELAQGQLNTRVSGSLLHREDEIGDLAREFNNMAEQLGLLIESRQQLLHDVSHELRAPLARLQAAAAIAQAKAGESAQAPLNRMEQECGRINALIQEILDFARLEKRQDDNQPIELMTFLEGIASDVRYEYPSHPVQLLPPVKPTPWEGSEELLRRAIENILRNACKHTPDNTPIDMALKTTKTNHVITLRDHGPGVDEADIEHLFTPFYRAGSGVAEGFGLGLSIAARAVHHHRGDITACNAQGGGLEVTIELPRNHKLRKKSTKKRANKSKH